MKKIASIIALIFLSNLVIAQELVGTWSDKELYSKKLSGYYDDFEGSNSKYVYSTSTIGRNRIFIVAHDKATMKETGSVALFDVKKEGDPKKREDPCLWRLRRGWYDERCHSLFGA